MRREIIVGTYYNPGSDVAQGRIGRKLDTCMYHVAKNRLRKGEHLYATITFKTHTAAVCVDDYKEFRQMSELLYPYDLYALSEAAHSRSV